MNKHTKQVIKSSTAGALDGSISFPQIVAQLMEVGVSSYHIDFLRAVKICYLRNDESHIEALLMPQMQIGRTFDALEMAAAVKASQTEGQKFSRFLERAFSAGCVGYFAYLDGRKVVYLGRKGEQHVEHFPS